MFCRRGLTFSEGQKAVSSVENREHPPLEATGACKDEESHGAKAAAALALGGRGVELVQQQRRCDGEACASGRFLARHRQRTAGSESGTGSVGERGEVRLSFEQDRGWRARRSPVGAQERRGCPGWCEMNGGLYGCAGMCGFNHRASSGVCAQLHCGQRPVRLASQVRAEQGPRFHQGLATLSIIPLALLFAILWVLTP
jgi:hypothetical protein